MRAIAVVAIIGLVLPSAVQSQPSAVLLETCNTITDAKRRLECLKDAVVSASAPAEGVGSKALGTGSLTVGDAATICEHILTGLQSKHNLASEESAKTTDAVLAVTWPPNEANY